jgi:hypothetical protein
MIGSPPEPGAPPDPVINAVLRIGRRTVVEIENDPRWAAYCQRDAGAEALVLKGRAAFSGGAESYGLEAADAGALVDELIRLLTLMRRGN